MIKSMMKINIPHLIILYTFKNMGKGFKTKTYFHSYPLTINVHSPRAKDWKFVSLWGIRILNY